MSSLLIFLSWIIQHMRISLSTVQTPEEALKV